jgi:hypothetical protein
LINVPSARFGVIRYPTRLAELVRCAESQPNEVFANFSNELLQNAQLAVQSLKELLAEIWPYLDSSNTNLNNESPFSSKPDVSAQTTEEMRGSLAQLAGHFVGSKDKQGLVIATG